MRKTLLFLSAVFLSGCLGYQPLYAPVKQEMRDIQILDVAMKVPDNKSGERRVAQYIHNQLSQYFTGSSESFYGLRVELHESKTTLAVRRDATEERLQLNLLANVKLISDGKILFETSVNSSAPYNVESSPLSTDFGKENARQNAAKVAAEEIRQRVAQYLYTLKQDSE